MDARRAFHKQYWEGNFSQRRILLMTYVKDAACRREGQSFALPENRRSRKRSTRYYMKDEEGTRVQVCKPMFLHSLGLKSDGRIKCFRKVLQGNKVSVHEDNRGGNRRRQPTIHKAIRDDIENYHPQVSHYTRMHAPLRRYLEGSLSVRKMYLKFLSSHRYMPIIYDTYLRVFQSQKITFGLPDADLCDLCEFAKVHLNQPHTPNSPACLHCGRIGLHRKFTAQARTHYDNDANPFLRMISQYSRRICRAFCLSPS